MTTTPTPIPTPTPTPSRDVLERIDLLCDHFEAAWKAGQQPRVEDYLGAQAAVDRDTLEPALLRVEAHYRGRARPPTPDSSARGPSPADRPHVAGFELLGELGRGGMGVVYKARQLRPNRLVALKMISSGAYAGPRELERFRCEADAVARFQHANIVQIYQVGEHDGRAYFAMEYVDGGSLERRLNGAPQPPRAAASLLERLALAIHHAHQRGIVHRDLKPANVLLQGADGTIEPDATTPKVTDFGLAKLRDDGPANRTRSGDLVGTPNYMAPEQVSGDGQVGAATDVYGLGAILYECLTGRPPFRAPTIVETVVQVQNLEPVSPGRLQPRCPRDLVTICLKCLSKQPRRRYASALELAEDLRRFLDGKPILARPIGPLTRVSKWARRQPMVAGLAVLLLLAVAAGAATGSWFWWQAEKGLARANVALENEQTARAARVATLDRYQVALAYREWLANDLRRAETLLDACTAAQRDTWEWRYLDRLRRSALHTFGGHENTVQSLAVHPAGRRVASASHDGTVWEWDLETGHGGRQVEHANSIALAVAYSPDGRLMASSDSRGRIKLTNLVTRHVDEWRFGGDGEVRLKSLAFDPSGRYLAVGGPRRLKVWDLHEPRGEPVYDRADAYLIWRVAFSTDGQYIATSSLTVKVWDFASRGTKPMYEWAGPGGGAMHAQDVAFSPDSDQVALGGYDGIVRVHSLCTGEEVFSINAHAHAVTSVDFSPGGGERLATAGMDGDMRVWDVRTRRLLFTLHGHSGTVWDLAHAADGTRLVSGGSDKLVRVWDAAGQEVTPLPLAAPNEIVTLAYGPGGRFLAWGDMSGRLMVRDLVRGRDVVRPRPSRSRGRAVAFAFCPSGRRVAVRWADGPPTMYNLEDGKAIPLRHAPEGKMVGLAFSAGGERLLAAQSSPVGLELRDLLSGADVLKVAKPGGAVSRVFWSPDARRFVTFDSEGRARVWDAESGRLHADLGVQPSRCITFSGDGGTVAFGGVEGWISVWDLTAAVRRTMLVQAHASDVFGLALSADGSRVASAASDCIARLWDTRTGHEVFTFRTRLHQHSRLAFSPDDADLVSIDPENRLQLWSTRGIRGSSPPSPDAGSVPTKD